MGVPKSKSVSFSLHAAPFFVVSECDVITTYEPEPTRCTNLRDLPCLTICPIHGLRTMMLCSEHSNFVLMHCATCEHEDEKIVYIKIFRGVILNGYAHFTVRKKDGERIREMWGDT